MESHYIPAAVVNRSLDHACTPVRAWREHLDLTQEAVAERLGIAPSAYAQQEDNPDLHPASRVKIAAALGIAPEQLDF
jgi:transcriptional regulator with XRE-family HTH domain